MNNQAIVVKINKIIKHPNADRLQLAKLFGTQVIVDNNVKEGDILIYVDSNVKLSPEFLQHNNLYRHGELNDDNTKTGFFDDNGRVRAIKIRGEISDGFLFPFDYLQWAGLTSEMPVGTEFDTINGFKICEKYVPKVRQSGDRNQPKKSLKKLAVPMFVEHWDTDQFMRNKHKIPANTICYIEEKVHGTSHRSGHVKIVVEEPISKFKRWIWNILSKEESKLNEVSTVAEWVYLNGTRRVIHTPNKEMNTFHDNTMREEVLEQVGGMLHKGEEIYLELFGYEKAGAHIQKGFPYGCKPGEYRALLYRVTLNNEDGKVADYNREAVYNRAEELGFEKPHLFEKFYYNGSEESMQELEEKVIAYAQGQSKMGNGAHDTLQEGVVIWFVNADGHWTALKYKSDAFRLKESSNKDKGIIDQEDLL